MRAAFFGTDVSVPYIPGHFTKLVVEGFHALPFQIIRRGVWAGVETRPHVGRAAEVVSPYSRAINGSHG